MGIEYLIFYYNSDGSLILREDDYEGFDSHGHSADEWAIEYAKTTAEEVIEAASFDVYRKIN